MEGIGKVAFVITGTIHLTIAAIILIFVSVNVSTVVNLNNLNG